MVSVKLLLFFVAVAVIVVVPSAGTEVLFTDRSDTLGIVGKLILLDVSDALDGLKPVGPT